MLEGTRCGREAAPRFVVRTRTDPLPLPAMSVSSVVLPLTPMQLRPKPSWNVANVTGSALGVGLGGSPLRGSRLVAVGTLAAVQITGPQAGKWLHTGNTSPVGLCQLCPFGRERI